MDCQITELGNNTKKLHVEISEEDFNSEIETVLKEMVKTVELPGFRKGKVPIQHLRSKLGEEQIRSDTLGHSLPKYIQEAIDSQNIDAIAVSDIQILSELKDSNVTFEASVEVRPEVELKGYENLKITIPPVLPTPEEITEIEANYLKSFGTLEDVSRNAISGDHLSIDIQSTFNGQDVDGMNVSDYVYEVGAPSIIEGLEKELTGAKIGDILEFNAPHPAQEGNMRVKVLVKKIQENKLPELDDEMAKKISEFETAEELKNDMTEQIKESKRNSILRVMQEKLLEELVKLLTGPLPETMMSSKVEELKQEIEPLKSQLPEEQLLKLDEQVKDQASKSVKIDLGLRAIIRQEKLEVEESELQKTVAQIQEQIDQLPPDSKKQLSPDLKPNIDTIKSNLLQQKAMEWLMENAEITDESGAKVASDDIKLKQEENIEEKENKKV